MKYGIGLVVLQIMVVFSSVQACQQECRKLCNKNQQSSLRRTIKLNLRSLGDSIDNAEVPLIGKLGNILPFAILGFCLQKLPEQTMLVLSSFLVYVLCNSENVRSMLGEYHKAEQAPAVQDIKDLSPVAETVKKKTSKKKCAIKKPVIKECKAAAVGYSFVHAKNNRIFSERPVSFL